MLFLFGWLSVCLLAYVFKVVHVQNIQCATLLCFHGMEVRGSKSNVFFVSQNMVWANNSLPYFHDISISGWWFGTFFIFPYIGNNHPNWLIFFRGVAQPPTRFPEEIFNHLSRKRAESSSLADPQGLELTKAAWLTSSFLGKKIRWPMSEVPRAGAVLLTFFGNYGKRWETKEINISFHKVDQLDG